MATSSGFGWRIAAELGGGFKRNTHSGGGCYISTACIEAAGLPDDCFELQVLRKFRDEYVRILPDGENMVKLYYSKAPALVTAISKSKDAINEYGRVFKEVQEAVRCIVAGQKNDALVIYRRMVERLSKAYSTK